MSRFILVPIAINNFSSQGWDPLLALAFVHSFALAGAILAIWDGVCSAFITNNDKSNRKEGWSCIT
ncbi:hypothetical protein CYL18_04185 [Pradoshia eiseniae]|uniref:Uncharacterized protein n=1 Tax=Pradoshia eiseniae TaxID=2064768 RepID=A0A2S7N561_9BACI|nr:hypothetical protein CYL18_04185 [Pradoshia eiseniae]